MTISLIIPVFNGGTDFFRCLEAIRQSSLQPDEIIVVDDSSTDSSAYVANNYATKVIKLEGSPKGPAYARNAGSATASGDVLVFIDADVVVHQNTLALIDEQFRCHPEVSALFGSYDDKPPKKGLVSQYKNLQHHYVHQHGQHEASTFWAGCGAVRREIFLQFRGFSESYAKPSIEDIEFGLRLKKAGYRIFLCREVLVTHLKQWSFFSLLRADIFQRAVPWTQLILSSSSLPSDLNLNLQSRLSALAVWAFMACFFMGFFFHVFWAGLLVSLLALIILNHEFYRLCLKQGGLLFGAGVVGLHALYYCYSSIIFVLFLAIHLMRKFVVRNSVPNHIRRNPNETENQDTEFIEDEEELEKAVFTRLMYIDSTIVGIVTGLFFGIGIFLATNILILKGGPVVGPHLALLGQYFFGYKVTFVGSLIGLSYGFVIGFLVGYCVSRLYNWLAARLEKKHG